MAEPAALLQGLGLSLAHAVAVSAQNAFVLRQGLRGRHPLAAAAGAALADALLIAAGVGGLGGLLGLAPALAALAAWAGAAYLVLHGVAAFRAALRPRGLDVGAGGRAPAAPGSVALAAAGFTLLSPHAYVDVLVLFGGLGARLSPDGRFLLAVGAVLASTAWYVALALGAARLAPLLRRPEAWRALDLTVAATMLTLAALLVRAALEAPG